jgi:hypothetical protein
MEIPNKPSPHIVPYNNITTITFFKSDAVIVVVMVSWNESATTYDTATT